MKILKRILLGILALIVLFLIIAVFMKKDYAIEKETIINKPKSDVFDYVKSLKNQKNWSTWEQSDPNMTSEYTGTDGIVGFKHAWKSKMMGDGEQEITKIIEGERMESELRFKGFMGSNAPAYLSTEAIDSTKTKVKWGMSGTMSYPMNGMQIFMSMEKMIGTEYQKSLINLKSILEKQ
jgi:uncharacterized membrane protein